MEDVEIDLARADKSIAARVSAGGAPVAEPA
jgi:hypothetical protein